MDKTKKKNARKIIGWIALAALVALLTALPLIAGENAGAEGPVATVKTGTAETGTIVSSLGGGGVLAEESSEKLELPEGVLLKGYLVANGDYVHAGDPLAEVDKISLMQTISQIQETMDYLSEQISGAEDTQGAGQIKAITAGRVKQIFAEAGDDVQQVMLEHGALAVLSLDGRMAVTVERDTDYSAGESVSVEFEDGTRIEGRVESALGGQLTVSIADEGYAVGEKVLVQTTDGERLGTGSLEVNNPWKITAYYGRVKQVNVKENDKVTIGKLLFKLENTGHSTEAQILNVERQEYEELLEKLFRIYDSGYLTAPCDGYVYGVEKDSPWLLASAEESWQLDLLTHVETEAPKVVFLSEPEPPAGEGPPEGGEPPAEQKSYQVTKAVRLVSEVSPTEWMVQEKALSATVSDLSLLNISIPQMADPVLCTLTNVVTTDGQPHTLKAGDILLWVTEGGSSYWVCHSSGGGMTRPGGMGGFGNMGGMGSGQEEAFEKFDLTEETVLTVTPDKTMTLDITIDELDIAKLQVGQEASVTIPALGQDRVTGLVTEIGEAANSGGNSKFTVTITMDREGSMLAGMSAGAELVTGQTENVLMIPVAALNGNGSECFVYTGWSEKEGTLTSPVRVVTGVSDGEYVQILSGLSEGDRIYWNWYEPEESSAL